MSERRYTLSEIDKMREGIKRRNQQFCPSSISYTQNVGSVVATMTPESAAALESWGRLCEEQLRTALLAGVDPAEFDSAADA